jgi:hypothetical protein
MDASATPSKQGGRRKREVVGRRMRSGLLFIGHVVAVRMLAALVPL